MASTGLHGELHSLGISFGPMTKSSAIQKLMRKIGECGQTPLGNIRAKKRPLITMYRDNPFLATFRVRRKVMKMWIISCFFKISLFLRKSFPQNTAQQCAIVVVLTRLLALPRFRCDLFKDGRFVNKANVCHHHHHRFTSI